MKNFVPGMAAEIRPSLESLVKSANTHVPFYREHWQRTGCNVARLKLSTEFSALPIVTKADLLSSVVINRLDDRYRPDRLLRETTSGSTGQPFTMFFDRKIWLRRRLRFIRALQGCGYRWGHRLLLISSRHSSALMQFARWHYINLQLDDAAMCAKYQRLQPQTLYGPLSSLLMLAERLKSTAQRPHYPQLVISTAEQLTPTHRRLLERAFKAGVADFYGSTELGLLAWRDSASHGYHLFDKEFFVEFVPTKSHPELERLIVTELQPGPLPLIRFDTGDLVRRQHEAPGAPIVEFLGREVDRLTLPDGSRISPYQITMLLEEISGIDRYEIVQGPDYSVQITVWTQIADPTPILREAESAIAKLCLFQIKVSANPSKEQIATGDRKIRPVRSEVVRAQ